jgi:uncharacterized DUF497 family protein
MVGEPENIDAEELEFDENNVSHLARHGVSREAVEQVHRNTPDTSITCPNTPAVT